MHDPRSVSKIVDILRTDGLAIISTDTVYGLICDATSIVAVEKLYHTKQRSLYKPMAMFVAQLDELKDLINIDDDGQKIIDTFLPGPLTVVASYAHTHGLAWPLLSAEGNIGVRLPSHEFCLAISMAFGRPIVATSVNFSGEDCVTDLSAVPEKILDAVDAIVDGPMIHGAEPSTVLRLVNGIEIMREGPISMEHIMQALRN